MQSTEYIDFRQYWLVLKRRWLPGVVVFGTVIVLATLNTLLQKSVYQASGRLLIKTPTGITSALEKDESEKQIGEGELNAVGEVSDPVQTKIGLISSPSLAQKLIETLNLELELTSSVPQEGPPQIQPNGFIDC